MNTHRLNQVPGWILMAVMLLILAYAFLGADRFWNRSDTQQTESVRQAILRAAAHCYALEGSYPADLGYLEENYGLILDHKRYSYVYEVFASNIRPEVEVLSWNADRLLTQ